MAEPAPLPSNVAFAEQQSLSANPENEELSTALRDELFNEFLPQYEPQLKVTDQVDGLNNRFTININQPLPHLDTATAKAYSATDPGSPQKEYYALVCDKHLPVRQKLAQKLLTAENCPLIKLMAEGVTHLSSMKEDRYVLIYEQPKGQTLREVIEGQVQAFSDRYVIETVAKPLSHAVLVIERLGFSHGRINPDNIYVNNGKLVLGECCSEPCGYSQDFHYEPINFIQAHPAGKGHGQGCLDSYALGAIVALMKLKPKSLQIQDKEAFVRRLLEEGAYIGIAGYVDLSDEMNDLLRGTLNDNLQERWRAEQIDAWTQGKRFNLLTPNIPSLGSRPFEFQGQGFLNLRQLANAIYHAPEQAVPLLEDGSIARWIETATRRKEITEYINRVIKSYRSITKESIKEIITRCLFALDHLAPVRMSSASMHIDGVGVLLAEMYHQKDQTGLNDLRRNIAESMFANWQDALRANFNINKIDPKLQDAVWIVDRAHLDINNKNYGFGIERLLYELNPLLPCQSEILKNHYVINLRELLIALDHVAKQSDRPNAPFDRHIAAFIGAKVPLNKPLKFNRYEYYPDTSKHQGLLALKFLQKAQEHVKGQRFPGLAAWIVASITDVIGSFHSRTLRQGFCDRLSELAKEGDLLSILHYIISHDYSTADAQGFITATTQYAEFGAKIDGFNNEELLEFRAYRLGSTIAKVIAFAVFVIMLLYYFNVD